MFFSKNKNKTPNTKDYTLYNRDNVFVCLHLVSNCPQLGKAVDHLPPPPLFEGPSFSGLCQQETGGGCYIRALLKMWRK